MDDDLNSNNSNNSTCSYCSKCSACSQPKPTETNETKKTKNKCKHGKKRKYKKRKKKIIKTILTRRGYAIVKEHFGFRDIHNCKKDLTVAPFVNENVAAKPSPFPVYLESMKKLYLPRHYGIEHFGEPDKIKINKCYDIDLKFKGSLRENQLKPVNAFLKSCEEGTYSSQSYGGILSLPCGYGKTICALYLLAKLGKKTIIVVHKEFLMEQWIERIEQFLPDARIGIIQQNKVKVQGKDIVIAMIQSISMKNYPMEIFDQFGLSIFDECHHISSQVFSRCLPKVGNKYMLGLSATPKRKDGLSKVFHWYLGPMIYEVKKREEQTVNVEIINFKSENEDYTKTEMTNYGKISMPKMINNVCYYAKRNDFIVKLLAQITKDPKRKIIVLADRRQQLKYIYDSVNHNEICTIGYYVGGMKKKERKISETKQVMLGTYSMSSEGLDVKELNTVIFASPKSDIVQSIGRILRMKTETIPTAYDIVDASIPVFTRQSMHRKRFYKKNNYTITYHQVMDTTSTNVSTLIKQFNENTKRQTKINFKKQKEKFEKELEEKCFV